MAARKSTTTPTNKTPKPATLRGSRSKKPLPLLPREPETDDTSGALTATFGEVVVAKVKGAAIPEKVKRDLRIEHTTEQLLCRLTDEQLLEISRRSSRLTAVAKSKKDALAQYNKTAKSEISKFEADIADLQGKILSGGELRAVECQVTYNYQTNSVRTVRLDTEPAELVTERTMEADELKLQLHAPDGTGIKTMARRGEPKKKDEETVDLDEADPHEGERPGDITY